MRSSVSPLPAEHVRVWLLLMLRAASVAGLAPVGAGLFHRLVFLSNSLAQLYEANPPSDFVLKHKRGPFYPQAQFEVERMAAMGLVDLGDVEWVKAGQTIEARLTFAVSKLGISKSREWIETVGWCRQVDAFLTDLCAAVASVGDGMEIEAADHDLTYAQGWAGQYSVIAFRRPEQRLSERGIESITALLPPNLAPSRQHRLKLYLKYLERVAA